MDLGRVHLYASLLIIPVSLIFALPFLMIWDIHHLKAGIEPLNSYFIPVLLTGIIAHEFLHGFCWSFFVPGGMKSIKFGIQWKFLSPYCHCKAPIKVFHYKIGTIMPLLITGILPAAVALGSGNGTFLLFSIIFTWMSGGDIISLFMLKELDNDRYVYDHPGKMGFYIKK